MWSLIQREPLRVTALASTAINLAVLFGLGWSAEQITGVNVFLAAVLGIFVRETVTSNPNVDALVRDVTGVKR